EAQISTQWILTLVDAFLHADHDRAPSTAELLAMLDQSALSPRRGHHKGSTHHRIGLGNGFERTSIECARCLVWVKSCPDGPEVQLPLYPRKRTQRSEERR